MYDAVLALCERIVYQHSYTAAAPRPEGNRHPLLSPFDILPAADGWVAVAAPSDVRRRNLCELIDRPDLANDPTLATNEPRVARRDEIYDALAAWTRPKSKAEILDRLGGQVPVGAVRDAAEIAADPHVTARDMLAELDQPGHGTDLRGSRPAAEVFPDSRAAEAPCPAARRTRHVGARRADNRRYAGGRIDTSMTAVALAAPNSIRQRVRTFLRWETVAMSATSRPNRATLSVNVAQASCRRRRT